MRKGVVGLALDPPLTEFVVETAIPHRQSEEAPEEAMFVGGEPQSTGPVVLSPEDSRRLQEVIQNKAPVVLTARMQEAIANYKRMMSEVAD